jgi:hypothetical protein
MCSSVCLYIRFDFDHIIITNELVCLFLGLNGSSKSLASTHPMLARGISAERFSPLQPRDFEVESLSRKTNNIVILRGKKTHLKSCRSFDVSFLTFK